MKPIANIGLMALVSFLVISPRASPTKADAEVVLEQPPAFSYLNQARKIFDSGAAARSQAQALSLLMPNQDQNTSRTLRDYINKATDLINNYRQNGLSNMPNLPNVLGMGTVTRLPDKLLRAELSMLQDLIKMSQEMVQNPLYATMNSPKDIANMMTRIVDQFEK